MENLLLKIFMTNFYNYAKRYLELGWSLLPMQFVSDSKGEMVKHPMVQWKRFQTEQPTLDEVVWWLENGWFLGLVTGKLSNLCVIDDDRIKFKLSEYGFTSSVVAKTKSGGKHFFYRYSEGITNTANEDIHVDVRGEGGYVVLAPFNGYEWLSLPTPENLKKLQPFPEELKKIIYKNGLTRTEPIKISEIVGTEKGNRDNNLLSFANSLCRRYPKEEWESGVFPALLGMNNTFPDPLSASNVQRIFLQATRFISSQPSISYKLKNGEVNRIERNKVITYSTMPDSEIMKIEERETMKLGLPLADDTFDWPTGYYVICGSPGVGKGFFALWLARKFWENGKKKSIYFTLEMGEKLVRTRILQAWSDLTLSQFKKKANTQKAQKLMKQDVISVYPFGQKDSRYQTPENFEKDFEEIYQKGYRVFIFDHLHELEGTNTNDTNQAIVERWGKVFQNIMKKPEHIDVWLFVFAQPNGASIDKKIIGRTDIAGSKSITQKCEFFISLNRKNNYYKKSIEQLINESNSDNREMFVWIDKNRISLTQYKGFNIYFGEDGNFYTDINEAHNQNQNMGNETEIDKIWRG